MSPKIIMLLFSVFAILFIAACGSQTSEFKIENEKYTLENGMEIILHDDKSDPIVSVAVLYMLVLTVKLKEEPALPSCLNI